MAENIEMIEIEKYSDSSNQVTSVTQFSDVYPTDWAYQALSNLVQNYGCVAGYPDGLFRGSRAMTRYEAAALLNACLDRVTEVTDEIRRLQAEFKDELIVLTARVDGLDAKVGQLQATQFSTTTKLSGEANFILSGVPDYNSRSVDADGTTLNYDVRLNFDTSFTGNDLLRTSLRAGNFNSLPFGSETSLFNLDKAQVGTDDVVIDRLYYQFPVSENVRLTVGPKVRNTEMSWIPSAYTSEVLTYFNTAGAPGVYNRAVGAGFGVQYEGDSGLIGSLNYVAENGNDSSSGLFSSDGALNVLAQLGYRQDNWGVGVGYRYGTTDTRPAIYNGVRGSSGLLNGSQDSNSVSVNAYWQPSDRGIIPSVSAGYGYNDVSGTARLSDATDSQSWFVGLQWDDVWLTGNALGVAVGQPPVSRNVNDTPVMVEVFYKYQLTDNISITPAVFYVSSDPSQSGNTSEIGGVVQTTFRF